MSRFRFPFTWGAPSTDTVIVVTVPPFWARVSANAQTWTAVRPDVLPRFEHIYSVEADAALQWSRLTAPVN